MNLAHIQTAHALALVRRHALGKNTSRTQRADVSGREVSISVVVVRGVDDQLAKALSDGVVKRRLVLLQHLRRRPHGARSVERLGARVVGEERGALGGLQLGELCELVGRGEDGGLGGEDVGGCQGKSEDGAAFVGGLERGELGLAPAGLVALDSLEHGEFEAGSWVAGLAETEDGGLHGHELVLDGLEGEDQMHGVGAVSLALVNRSLVLGEGREQSAVSEVCRSSSRALAAVEQSLDEVSGTASRLQLLLEHRLDHGEPAKRGLAVHAGELQLRSRLVDKTLLARGGTAVAVVEHEASGSRVITVGHGGELSVLASEDNRNRHHHGWSLRSSSEGGGVSHV